MFNPRFEINVSVVNNQISLYIYKIIKRSYIKLYHLIFDNDNDISMEDIMKLNMLDKKIYNNLSQLLIEFNKLDCISDDDKMEFKIFCLQII